MEGRGTDEGVRCLSAYLGARVAYGLLKCKTCFFFKMLVLAFLPLALLLLASVLEEAKEGTCMPGGNLDIKTFL